MNIVCVASSMREGNSTMLCKEFARGAIQAGHKVNMVDLKQINLTFCHACSDCYNKGKCTQKDDMNKLYPQIKNADLLVLATPIYFNNISGQLKVFIDRLYPLYQQMKTHQAIVIASCYQNSKSTIDSSLESLRHSLADLNSIEIVDIIYGEGTDKAGDITTNQLQLAYNKGKNLA